MLSLATTASKQGSEGPCHHPSQLLGSAAHSFCFASPPHTATNPFDRSVHPMDSIHATLYLQREYMNSPMARASQPDTTSFSSSKETLAGKPTAQA